MNDNDKSVPTCPACGTPWLAGQSRCAQCGASPDEAPEKLTWEAAVPLMRSTVVLRQLAIALLVPFTLVASFLLILQAIEGDLTWASAWQIVRIFLLIMGGFVLLSVLIILLFYGNRYEYRFTLDKQGITAATTGRTRKKNTIVNVLLILSGRPSAAGAGLLAHSRQGEHIRWQDVDGLTAHAGRHEIVLRRGKRAVMLVQCTAENYEPVLNHIRQALD